MLEKFSWEGISGFEGPKKNIERDREDKIGAKSGQESQKSEGNFEMPNSVVGRIVENSDGTITFSTEFGDWVFPLDKFKELCPDWEKGEATVSFIDNEKLAKNVLKELLNSHEDAGEQN